VKVDAKLFVKNLAKTAKVMYAYHHVRIVKADVRLHVKNHVRIVKVMYAYHLVRTVKELLVNLVNGHVIIKYVNLAPKTVNVQMSALAVIVVIVVNIHVVIKCVKVYVNMNVKALAKEDAKPLVNYIAKTVLNSANVLIPAGLVKIIARLLLVVRLHANFIVKIWANAKALVAKINFIYV
jgi:hypothetical protein